MSLSTSISVHSVQEPSPYGYCTYAALAANKAEANRRYAEAQKQKRREASIQWKLKQLVKRALPMRRSKAV